MVGKTWLNDTISDSEVSIDGYDIIRNDRVSSRGGGVCLYVNKYLDFNLVPNTMISLI